MRAEPPSWPCAVKLVCASLNTYFPMWKRGLWMPGEVRLHSTSSPARPRGEQWAQHHAPRPRARLPPREHLTSWALEMPRAPLPAPHPTPPPGRRSPLPATPASSIEEPWTQGAGGRRPQAVCGGQGCGLREAPPHQPGPEASGSFCPPARGPLLGSAWRREAGVSAPSWTRPASPVIPD